MTFVGYRHNIEVCKFLFDSIKGQMEREFKVHCNERKAQCEEWGYPYRFNRPSPKTFYMSAYREIQAKLIRMKRDQNMQSQQEAVSNESVAKGNALMIRRNNEVALKVATLGWKSGRSYSAGHSNAGAAAGKRVRIQQGLTGNLKLNG